MVMAAQVSKSFSLHMLAAWSVLFVNLLLYQLVVVM